MVDRVEDCDVFAIANHDGVHLWVNLQGPLIVSSKTWRGVQAVLSEKKYHTRHVLGTIAAQNSPFVKVNGS